MGLRCYGHRRGARPDPKLDYHSPYFGQLAGALALFAQVAVFATIAAPKKAATIQTTAVSITKPRCFFMLLPLLVMKQGTSTAAALLKPGRRPQGCALARTRPALTQPASRP